MKMNRIAAAALAGAMLAAPVLAEDTAWTPPTVTQEEMDAVHLGERILMRGTEGDDVRLIQQRLYDLGYLADDVDGKFGLQTQKAVRAFQRAHKLEKIDGKVGKKTIAALFGDNVIALPTPTPSPTPSPTPTPVPTATPTAKPDLAKAPFAMREADVSIEGKSVDLVLGQSEQGETLYPLCGVMKYFGYDCTWDEKGGWQLVEEETGAQCAVMTDGTQGLCKDAMMLVNGVILLTDDEHVVYAYGGEAYLNAALFAKLGVEVSEAGELIVLEKTL